MTVIVKRVTIYNDGFWKLQQVDNTGKWRNVHCYGPVSHVFYKEWDGKCEIEYILKNLKKDIYEKFRAFRSSRWCCQKSVLPRVL